MASKIFHLLRSVGRYDRHSANPVDKVVAKLRFPLDRRYLQKVGCLRDLHQLAQSVHREDQQDLSGREKKVLVCSLRSWVSHTAYEQVIAQALHQRGNSVSLLTCGGGLPICEVGWARKISPRPCDRCAAFTRQALRGSQLESLELNHYFPRERDVVQLSEQISLDWAVNLSTPWVLKSPNVDASPEGKHVRKDFMTSATLIQHAAEKIFDDVMPDIVFMISGLFAAERVIREVALQRGIQVVTYEIAPRENSLVLSQEDPAPLLNTDSGWEIFKDQPLSLTQEKAIKKLMNQRARGIGSHESYFDHSTSEEQEIRQRLNLAGKRVVSLFTNITWDSAALYRDVGFSSLAEWLLTAVHAMKGVPDTVLVIRVHPAEKRWESRDSIQNILKSNFGELPDNVRLVLPEETIHSYTLIDLSELVLAYTSTIGLEAACRGTQVAVAGETHYSKRGFTVDVENKAQLIDLVQNSKSTMTEDQRCLAWRYAFMFFFRYVIPFPSVKANPFAVESVVKNLEDLSKDQDPYLDFICNEIMNSGSFILPDHLLSLES